MCRIPSLLELASKHSTYFSEQSADMLPVSVVRPLTATRTPTFGLFTANEKGAVAFAQTASPDAVPSSRRAALHGEVPALPQVVSCVAGLTDSSTKYASALRGAKSLTATGTEPVARVC